MLIFKTLIRSNLISTKISNIRTHILCSQSITTMATSAILKSAHYPFAPFLLPPSLPAVIRLTSCGEISQQSSFGPLFLSSAPWMLMQSATPMYLLGTDVKSSVGFTDTVRREKVTSSGLWIARNCENVSVMEDGIFNLPNLISISRMLSGPIIGWYILYTFKLFHSTKWTKMFSFSPFMYWLFYMCELWNDDRLSDTFVDLI